MRFQNLDHKEGNPLSKYLTEGRKFGVSLILATQNISNMNKEERSRMFNAEQSYSLNHQVLKLKHLLRLLLKLQTKNR
jgi:DNA phosphorothioation-dependent restriction protein DptH